MTTPAPYFLRSMYCASTPMLKPTAVLLDDATVEVMVGPGSATVSEGIVSCFTEKIVGPRNSATSSLLATGIIQIASRWTAVSECFRPANDFSTERGLSKKTGSGMLPLTEPSDLDATCEIVRPASRLFPQTL